MSTLVEGYCAIFDYDFSPIVYTEGVEGSGGAAAVEEITVAGRKYADVRGKGRQPKKYKVKARSLDRDEIETFLRTCNTLPDEAEFFPFDEERMGYIASAFAALQPVQRAANGYNFYEATAEITCREAWLYGPDQGIPFGWYMASPAVSAVLTNDGHERAPISYMQFSGDYAGSYIEDLSVRIVLDGASGRDRELAVCEKMLRADIFEVGWRGEARHSYETDFGKPLSAISADLHGLVSGGIWGPDRLLLANGDYLMIPFYGPLPVAGTPGAVSLQLDIEAIGGSGGAVQVAEAIALSDIAEVDHDDLVVGSQEIPIPNLQGKGLAIIGVKADVDPITPFAGPTAGACRAVAMAPDGTLYAVSDLGDLWSWTAAAGWVMVSDCDLQDISVSAEGTVWAVSAATHLVYWVGGDSWADSPFGGAGYRACMASDTKHYVVGTDWKIYQYIGWWHETGISATDIHAAGDGSVFYLSNGVCYQIVDGTGVSIGGSGFVAVAAASATRVYALDSTGKVWQYDGSAWAETGATGIGSIDTSCYGALAGSTTGDDVWIQPYILLSRIKGAVNRYIAPSKIPWADPDEDFQIRVESSAGEQLRFCQVCWQNRYWY